LRTFFFSESDQGWANLVEDQAIVEINWVEIRRRFTEKQLRIYLRLADKRLRLPSNFSAALIKYGIIRVVNGLENSLTRSRQDATNSSEATGVQALPVGVEA
jgi:hypothetical protein